MFRQKWKSTTPKSAKRAYAYKPAFLWTVHPDPTFELERYKQLVKYDADALLEEYRQNHSLRSSVIDFAIAAIKILLLINGGAAIAILAFLGAIAGKSPETPKQIALQVTALIPALHFFIVGVFFAGVTAAVAYMAQVLFAEMPTVKSRKA